MAVVTASSLCMAVLRKLRAIDPDETPSATELDNVFTELKRMLKTWGAKALAVYSTTEDTHTLTSGTKSYTIGSGATIDTDRPIKLVEGCYVNYAGRDYTLDIIGEAQYNKISEKDSGQSSTPSKIFYKPSYSDGEIFLWPPGGGTLYLYSLKHLNEASLIDNNVMLPDEYQDAIVWNLACRMAPEFIGEPTPYMLAMAAYTMEAIENINAANDPPEADMDIRMIAPDYTLYDVDAG